jgi:hypothetical protein
MPTAIQTARSSVPLARPTTGARAPGELYVNWPDKQIGVIDASQAPLDLLAVRFYSAATVYQPGDIVSYGGDLYRALSLAGPEAFDPAKWELIGKGSASLELSPPTNPQPGQFWFNPNNGQLYLWYADADSSQWVSVSGVSTVTTAALLQTIQKLEARVAELEATSGGISII